MLVPALVSGAQGPASLLRTGSAQCPLESTAQPMAAALKIKEQQITVAVPSLLMGCKLILSDVSFSDGMPLIYMTRVLAFRLHNQGGRRYLFMNRGHCDVLLTF